MLIAVSICFWWFRHKLSVYRLGGPCMCASSAPTQVLLAVGAAERAWLGRACICRQSAYHQK